MSISPIASPSGMYYEKIVGIGLSAAEQDQALDQRALSEGVSQAIRDAMARARLIGLNAFEPDSSVLVLPSSSPGYVDQVRELFARVLGRPYSAADELLYPELPPYGPLSLAEWSNAEETLAEYSASLVSMLSPGAGGGPAQARGHWFVNGQRFTLAELFLTIRVGNLNGLDRTLEADLNNMVANVGVAKQLMEVLSDMKLRRGRAELEAADAITDASQASLPVMYDAVSDYQAYVDSAGLTVDYLATLGLQFKGAASYLPTAAEKAHLGQDFIESEYDDIIDEIQSIFDSINSQNDVKRLEIEDIQNQRVNMLAGLSTMQAGIQAVNQTLGKNLG